MYGCVKVGFGRNVENSLHGEMARLLTIGSGFNCLYPAVRAATLTINRNITAVIFTCTLVGVSIHVSIKTSLLDHPLFLGPCLGLVCLQSAYDSPFLFCWLPVRRLEMLRIGIKFPYRGTGITRIQTHGAPRLYLASRYYQSKSNEGGGGGGRTFVYLLGTATLVTGATVALAHHDPDFRHWLGDNVPYSDDFIRAVLQEQNTYSEQFYEFLNSAKSVLWSLFVSKPKEVDPNELRKAAKAKTEVQVEEKKEYKVEGEAPTEQESNRIPEMDPRSLADLELKIGEAATVAINSYNQAAEAIRDYSEDVYVVVEESVQNLDPSIWPKLKEKSDITERLVKEAECAAAEAVEYIERMQEILNKGPIDAPEEVVESSKRNIQDVLEDVDKARTDLEKERRRASVTDKYWEKVEEARKHWTDEMEILFPGVNLNERELKITSGELDLFILYAFQNVLFYQKELKKLESYGECRLKAALAAGTGEEGEQELIMAQVELQLDKERRDLEMEYNKKCLELRMEGERDLRLQMKRQAEAHADHLKDALEAKEMEVDRRYRRIADEFVANEQAKYKQQLAAMMGKLQGLQASLNANADANKNAQQSQVLWSACQALHASLRNNDPTIPWAEQLRPLAPEICAVKKASKQDELVGTVVKGIPNEAFERGVFTEEALRERFLKVERIARQVALVPDGGGSIPLFLLSYLQSFLLVRAVSPIPQAELADQPINLDTLSTYDVLKRARYWLDRGDFAMTLRYLNLLKGASRQVACDWMNEARILLETQQAANALMDHASASGLLYL